MTDAARYYGVSSGDGNNGVSHMFPEYYVKTDDPWRLAKLAALTMFKPGEGLAWAKDNMDVDGDAEHTISVTFRESAETQEARAQLQARYDEMDEETPEAIELARDIEDFGTDYAWLIVEVFPEDDRRVGCPVYGSLAEAFGEQVNIWLRVPS